MEADDAIRDFSVGDQAHRGCLLASARQETGRDARRLRHPRGPCPPAARRESRSRAPRPTPLPAPRCRPARRSAHLMPRSARRNRTISRCRPSTSGSITRKSRSLPARASPRACDPNRMTLAHGPASLARITAALAIIASSVIAAYGIRPITRRRRRPGGSGDSAGFRQLVPRAAGCGLEQAVQSVASG